MIKTSPDATRQIFDFDGHVYACPTYYDVSLVTREDVLGDSNIQPVDGVQIVQEEDEDPRVYSQVGTVEIEGTTYGVATIHDAQGSLIGHAVSYDGETAETYWIRDPTVNLIDAARDLLNDRDFGDREIRDLRREAVAAGDAAQVKLCDLAVQLGRRLAVAEADEAGVEDGDGPRGATLAECVEAWQACREAVESAAAMVD